MKSPQVTVLERVRDFLKVVQRTAIKCCSGPKQVAIRRSLKAQDGFSSPVFYCFKKFFVINTACSKIGASPKIEPSYAVLQSYSLLAAIMKCTVSP